MAHNRHGHAAHSFKDFVADQLRDVKGVVCRAMFSGYGAYSGDIFFGIIHKDRLYFKTDQRTRLEYQELGMQSLRPNARQTLTTYYEVPVDIIEDPDQLAAWARKAMACNKTKPLTKQTRR